MTFNYLRSKFNKYNKFYNFNYKIIKLQNFMYNLNYFILPLFSDFIFQNYALIINFQ